jgi:hypothetical protein
VDGLAYSLHWPTTHSCLPRGQGLIRSCRSDSQWHLSGEGKLPRASLSDGGFILFGTYLWNVIYSKWFLPGGAYPLAVS